MKPSLTKGLTVTRRHTVDRDKTIEFMGDDLRVYATPSMLMDIEITCRDLIQEHLDDGQDSVGAHVEMDHMGATLNGMWVDITATVTDVDERRVSFEAEVRDAMDQVGRAKHVRFVIDKERQKQRLEKKAAKVKELG